MCGIVGYVGKHSALQPVLDGLQSLEYRGYDSAGITALHDNTSTTIKQIGQVQGLADEANKNTDLKNASIAIGHTRWATHGSPTQTNAHPHFNTDKTIFVVHNGIVENHEIIRSTLQKKGYVFKSETDTEVIPHLIDWHLRESKDFKEAFKKTILELSGAYAVAALNTEEPDKIYVARLSSPLIIGVGKDEHYIASDATAVMQYTKEVIYLDDYDIAEITAGKVAVHNVKDEEAVSRSVHKLDFDAEEAKLGDYPHYMIKEIFEAPQTIIAATRGRVRTETNTIKLGGLENVEQQLKYIDRIVIVACGTSYYAGLIGEYLIEEIAGIPVEVQLASEFKYRDEPFSRGTAILAISQSGETADTIAALKKVEKFGVLRLGVVNAPGSTIARLTDAGVYCHAGPEQSVASTKAFISQVTVLAEIALFLTKQPTNLFRPMLEALIDLPKLALETLETAPDVKKLAKKYAHYRDFLYIGRGYSYPCALEGALKLKEVSYIHAEGYAAGEMKHGPLAMIDKDFPVFAFAPKTKLVDKTYSNMEEIRARKGPVLAVATKGNDKVDAIADDVLFIPDCIEQLQPVLLGIVAQLFSYYIAVEKKLNVDRPRNLAKSVTVE